jgi:hypothetical protein
MNSPVHETSSDSSRVRSSRVFVALVILSLTSATRTTSAYPQTPKSDRPSSAAAAPSGQPSAEALSSLQERKLALEVAKLKSENEIQGKKQVLEITKLAMGTIPKWVHAAVRLECFFVDGCVDSSCS